MLLTWYSTSAEYHDDPGSTRPIPEDHQAASSSTEERPRMPPSIPDPADAAAGRPPQPEESQGPKVKEAVIVTRQRAYGY
ncbi:hypothetical protein AK812_SmicGene46550 [Symbiodinium microadriaticum]|uniref:Uncharacterized protein n=1 Tax=Symbiodinium microadriaticum TaxID=2951 RepID=A0A1Q9BTU8_SYMMI|nr:hypothetical protein AK812_SmicGene46550 [Symbiodinium microadriaticum]